jgi:hypothetical protein
MSLAKSVSTKSFRSKPGLIAVLALASISAAFPADAAIINGGFEAGSFTGWTAIGDTRIVTSAFGSGPTSGAFEALAEGGSGGASVPALETFLGLPGGSLNALGNGVTHGGSAIQQTFGANAGQTLTFAWNFITDEQPPSIFNDFAFWSLNSLSTLAGANGSSLIPFSSSLQTGFHATSFLIPVTGTYTLSLGVANVSDTGGLPQLLVDDVQLASVPEPVCAPGVAFAMAAMLAVLRRRRQTSTLC